MIEGIASRFHSLASLAVALMLTAAPAPARAAEPIKVGFMAPLSGIFAQAGKDMLEGLKQTVEDPRGPIKLDESGNPTQNVYILKVERVDGKLTNTVLHTYPMVSQFWTYKADEFLKLPAYGRDYPPARP